VTARRVLFWLHLTTGIIVGSVVAFLAVTGCILAFQPQIIGWSEHRLRTSTAQTQTCTAPSEILTTTAGLGYGQPLSWTSYANPHRPDEIAFPKGRLLLVDACSGRLLDTNAGRLRGFFDEVHDLHRYVALVGTRNEGLRSIKNACVLAFVFLLLSGLILWLPRQWTWKHTRVGLVPKWKGFGRASEWSLHTVAGFWLFLPLVTISLTGLIMAYAWANGLLYRAAGDTLPSVRAERELKTSEVLPVSRYKELDPLIAKAAMQDPSWTSLTLRVPLAKGKDIAFSIDEGEGGDPRTKSQLTLARKSAEVLKWAHYQDNTRGRRWRLLAHFIHTGELFGLTGQMVAFFTALGALLLVVTGFSLSIRRWLAWRSRKRRAVRTAHRAPDAVAV
jgi:uncharacterized iron-regulated membrane protein